VKLLPPPGPQRTRQLVLLGMLGVALALFLWRQAPWRTTAAAPRTASNGVAASQPASTGAGTSMPQGPTMPEPVKLEKLEPVPDEPGAGRNLFRFGVRPLPPPPPAPPPAPLPPPAPPVKEPWPPPIDLQVQGLIKRPDGVTVVYLKEPKTGTVLSGVEGQVLDGKYKIVKVGEQSVIVSYVDGSGQRTIVFNRFGG